MKGINDIKVNAEIVKCHIINTPQMLSNEGQLLLGYKLIVRGILRQVVEYMSNTPEELVNSAHHEGLFSIFIVLP